MGSEVGTLYGRGGENSMEFEKEQPEQEESRETLFLCLGENVLLRPDFIWSMMLLSEA